MLLVSIMVTHCRLMIANEGMFPFTVLMGQLVIMILQTQLMPPEMEQQEILGFLKRETERLDRLVSTVQEHIAKLREYRTALISAAVTGKIDVRGS